MCKHQKAKEREREREREPSLGDANKRHEKTRRDEEIVANSRALDRGTILIRKVWPFSPSENVITVTYSERQFQSVCVSALLYCPGFVAD